MITPKQAADAINYLFAAQAIQPVDAMDAVWSDYANAEIPDLSPADLLPAARLCLKRWASEGRSWKVDLPRFVEACRAIRRVRWEAWKQQHGEIYPDHPELSPEQVNSWVRAARAAILAGKTSRPEIEACAWQTIGQTPPAIKPTHQHHINIQQIGHAT